VKKTSVILTLLAVLVGIGYVVTLLAVRPMSTDLSVVGQGKPVLVLVYENHSPSSIDALDRLKQVRTDYEARLAFVVADQGTPDGQAFAGRYGLSQTHAMLLRSNGEPVVVMTIPMAEQDLRSRLDQYLATIE
jgi:thioredoxin-like negative regulator of GroEL